MNNIPLHVKEQLKKDPFMQRCALEDDDCAYEPGHRKIEWHHVIIFAGKQVQECWAIVGACSGYHHKFANRKDIQKRFTDSCVSRASDEQLRPFCKVIDYIKMKYDLA